MNSAIVHRRVTYVAIICLGLMAGAVPSAQAVPLSQVHRDFGSQTFTGKCCFSWNETVSVHEPANVVPVVVTWSTDFTLNSANYIFTGLMVNGGPCQSLGGGSFQQPLQFVSTVNFDVRTFQFIVLPSQGLLPGINTFTVCGGGIFSDTETIKIESNVLEVRFAK